MIEARRVLANQKYGVAPSDPTLVGVTVLMGSPRRMITDTFNPEVLRSQVAFITGGGSGINLAIGKALARLGGNVGICGRTAERLDAGRKELEAAGAKVFAAVADVRDDLAVQAAVAACGEALGPISFAVCGAAGNFVAPAEAISPKGFRTVVDIDLLGAFHAAHACFEQLRQTRGSLLFVSGGQSYVPFAYQAHVGAAKAGIDNLMANLALEWGRYGIRANSIVPGPIEGTEGMNRLGGDNAEAIWKAMTPLGRMGTMEDVANVAAFLATPLAYYISGARIAVDGGQNLTGSHVFNRAIGDALDAAKGETA
ncbi:SDR family oxidoreductase [Novosphingobium sp. MD-1]|uniref:SDR family oxidoreductase n=1 Tax=Novosphingobium sp. MD-1 TaxID=1630648 RepID=UPI001F358837|nr:SDR family oxidoreductase [Novosphingobium sp. MD-1]